MNQDQTDNFFFSIHCILAHESPSSNNFPFAPFKDGFLNFEPWSVAFVRLTWDQAPLYEINKKKQKVTELQKVSQRDLTRYSRLREPFLESTGNR